MSVFVHTLAFLPLSLSDAGSGGLARVNAQTAAAAAAAAAAATVDASGEMDDGAGERVAPRVYAR